MFSRLRRSWALVLVLLVLSGATASAQAPVADCDPLPGWWARADYLVWAVQGSGLPALVTANPAGTPRAQAGVLGFPDTTVMYGNHVVNNEMRSGFRVEGGWLGDPDWTFPIGIMANFFRLESQSEGFRASSDGSFTLARPFFNSNLNRQDSSLVAFPGLLSGSITARTRSDLLGTELNVIDQLYTGDCMRVGVYIGYRFLRYHDRLEVLEESTVLGSPVPIGTRLGARDSFSIDNDFHGCNFGVDFRYHQGALSFDVRTSLAVGHTFKQARIVGQSTFSDAGGTTRVVDGGLLALPTNSGLRTRNNAAVLPQLGVTVGYAAGAWGRFLIGYDFLYLSEVARAGSVIDPVLNPTQFPPGNLVGAARPQLQFNAGELWAQGVRIGFEVSY
jgi:hypothetical protein